MALEDISRNTANKGYTGQFRYDKGDILYSNKNNPEVLSKLGIGLPGQVLSVGPGGIPQWSSDAVLNIVSGISIPVALDHNKIFIGDASNLSTQVLVSGDASLADTGALTISARAVTFPKIQAIATASLLGRNTAGSGDIEVLSTIPSAVQDNITRLGTIVSGVWNGTVITTTYTEAKVIDITGTSNRITIGGTATHPTVDIAATYVGQTSITTLGTIGTGVWQGTSITTSYTQAQIISVTGTLNRISISGTSTDPIFDIAATYVGQTSINTLGTISTGVWQGTSISTTYTDAKIKTVTGTTDRITIGGTSTDPTFDIAATYVGQTSIVTTGTLTTGKLGTGYKIGGVTMELGSDANLDVYYSASGILTRIPVGSALQVLRVNAGATGFEYYSPTSGTITGATNVGGGNEVFKTVSGANLVFRTLIAGSSKLSITQNTNDLTLDIIEANIDVGNLTGTLLTTHGGTGLTSWTAGDLPYYATGTALSKLGIGTSGYFLKSTGSAPAWSALTSGEVTTALGYTPVNKNGDTMTGYLILNADPVSALGAVTKQYADALVSGLDWKASCRCATQANITLSGNQTIDGVTTVDGDRVLVMNQTLGENNGIYIADSGAWSRSPDADNSPAGEVTCGMFTFIEEGTVSGGFGYVLITANPIILGTTVLVFSPFSAGTSVVAGEALQFTGAVLDVLYDGTTIGLNGSNELELAGFGSFTTDDLTEGSTNKYYSNAQVDAHLSGTSNRITYTTGVIDIAATYVGQTSITTLGTITTGTWQGTAIADSYIASAATWNAKLSGTLTSAHIFVGNGSNVATDVAVSGDLTLANTGAFTIANDAVTTAKILNSNVTLAKIANIADQTILGNNSGGAAAPIALTASQTKVVLSLNNVENTALSTWAGSTNLTTLGTIGTGVWNGTSISTTYTDAKIKTVTGTSNRITIGGTATDPTFDIAATYVGQSSITTLGTIATGVWQGTSISTTYTDAKIKTVTGTSNRLTIGGTATDPTFDISTSYVGQATITTLGTITTGTLGTGAVIAGVTMTLGSDATGDIYYRESTGVLTRLAIGASGNVLSVSGGKPAWGSAGSGTITGSGTTNTVAKFTGTSAIGDSLITDDGTQVVLGTKAAIGIGTNSINGFFEANSDSTNSTIVLRASVSDTTPIAVKLRKSRGTRTSPTAIVTGDVIGQIIFSAFPGTSNFDTSDIKVTSVGTITNNQRPATKMEFSTTASNTSPAIAIRIDEAQQVNILTTTDASSTTTGALITAGGLGVAKKAYFGSTIFAAAATTSISSLNIPVGTAPSSPTSGDVWHDSTQKSMQVYTNAGIITNMSGATWVQAAATTFASSNAETTVFGTGVGTKTLPANFFVVGKTIRVTASGVFSTTGTPTLRIKLKLGSVIIYDSGLSATAGNVTNAIWFVSAIIICRSTGASGTVISIQTDVNINNAGAAQNLRDVPVTGTNTVDTTGTIAIDCTAQFSASSPSNTITCNSALIETLM